MTKSIAIFEYNGNRKKSNISIELFQNQSIYFRGIQLDITTAIDK